MARPANPAVSERTIASRQQGAAGKAAGMMAAVDGAMFSFRKTSTLPKTVPFSSSPGNTQR